MCTLYVHSSWYLSKVNSNKFFKCKRLRRLNSNNPVQGGMTLTQCLCPFNFQITYISDVLNLKFIYYTVFLSVGRNNVWCHHHKNITDTYTGFIRGILRGVRYAKSLRVLFLHRRSPSWTTLVLYSRVVFIFNEPTISYN